MDKIPPWCWTTCPSLCSEHMANLGLEPRSLDLKNKGLPAILNFFQLSCFLSMLQIFFTLLSLPLSNAYFIQCIYSTIQENIIMMMFSFFPYSPEAETENVRIYRSCVWIRNIGGKPLDTRNLTKHWFDLLSGLFHSQR